MQYMKRRWTLVALLSLLATAACSPPEDTGEAASGALPAAAEALPDSLAQMESVPPPVIGNFIFFSQYGNDFQTPFLESKQALKNLGHGVDRFPVTDIGRIQLLGIGTPGKDKS